MSSLLLVPGFRFVVTLHPADAFLPESLSLLATLVPEAAFKEVSGLSGELEVMSHAEGGVNNTVHQLPVRHSWSRITLRRGIVLGGGLWDWYAAGLHDPLGSRRDGTIILLSLQGAPMMAWQFTAGLAAKWSGPDLDATSDGLAMESLEIAHEGLDFIGVAASEATWSRTMVTIKILEVKLEVEGSEREQDFTRLFNEHMERWQRLHAEEAWRHRLLERERSLGKEPQGEE